MPKSLTEAKENEKGQRNGSGKRRRYRKSGSVGRGHRGRDSNSVTPEPWTHMSPDGRLAAGVGEWLTPSVRVGRETFALDQVELPSPDGHLSMSSMLGNSRPPSPATAHSKLKSPFFLRPELTH